MDEFARRLPDAAGVPGNSDAREPDRDPRCRQIGCGGHTLWVAAGGMLGSFAAESVRDAAARAHCRVLAFRLDSQRGAGVSSSDVPFGGASPIRDAVAGWVDR